MRASLVTALLLWLVACNNTAPDIEQDKDQIRKNTDNWIKGTARGDVDDYFRYITDDFIFIGQGQPISGRDSLRNFLQTAYSTYSISMPNWKSESLEISGSLATHQYGGIVYIRSKKDTVTLQSDRKYLDVLKKNEKGEWKVYLHAFNLNR